METRVTRRFQEFFTERPKLVTALISAIFNVVFAKHPKNAGQGTPWILKDQSYLGYDHDKLTYSSKSWLGHTVKVVWNGIDRMPAVNILAYIRRGRGNKSVLRTVLGDLLQEMLYYLQDLDRYLDENISMIAERYPIEVGNIPEQYRYDTIDACETLRALIQHPSEERVNHFITAELLHITQEVGKVWETYSAFAVAKKSRFMAKAAGDAVRAANQS
ncbi:MAG TPA: hypothetical protein VEA59_02135 [Patescibacteria group bacterium]|nr:hypothetical protein [Patescibacteria group bacterium]